jgi:hypothetical protein
MINANWLENFARTIRDIPFEFVKDRTLASLLAVGKASCTAKHLAFVLGCRNKGIRACLKYASFRYSEKTLVFHKTSTLFIEGGVYPHTFAEATIHDRRYLFDLTFDRWIGDLCPVNDHWTTAPDRLKLPGELVNIASVGDRSRRETLGLAPLPQDADLASLAEVNRFLDDHRAKHRSEIAIHVDSTICQLHDLGVTNHAL